MQNSPVFRQFSGPSVEPELKRCEGETRIMPGCNGAASP